MNEAGPRRVYNHVVDAKAELDHNALGLLHVLLSDDRRCELQATVRHNETSVNIAL